MKCVHLLVPLFFICACSGISYDELEDFNNFLKSTSHLDLAGNRNDYDEEDEPDDPSEHAWEDSGKFEGDLVLNDKQRRVIVQDVAEGLSRNGLKDSTKKWPNNEITYYIQREHFSSDQVQAIQSGMDDIEQASCVKFKPYKKGDRDAVVIQGSRRGCFSQVGYQSGYQVLNLSGKHPVGRGCFRHGTVVHELLHTLGFYHMQSSPDRDDFIDIAWGNIIERAKHNFRKYNAFAVTDFGVGYDYDSVLHYSKRAFSVNGKDTIVPKKSGVDIGQRVGLSEKDTEKLNKMYCDADSNNYEQEEISTQKLVSKKKSRKNKPFEGHGIGYHQGKTVVIKLPAATTYQLPDLPSYHVFDYFSKAPQALSPSLIQGVGIGKELTYSYKPLASASWNLEEQKNSAILAEILNKANDIEIKGEKKFKHSEEIESKITENEPIQGNVEGNEKITLNKTLSKGQNQTSEYVPGESDDDLSKTIDRLGKIIKTHVYPSQTTNLDIYKLKYGYIPKEMLKSTSEQQNVDHTEHESGSSNISNDKDSQITIINENSNKHITFQPKSDITNVTSDYTPILKIEQTESYPSKIIQEKLQPISFGSDHNLNKYKNFLDSELVTQSSNNNDDNRENEEKSSTSVLKESGNIYGLKDESPELSWSEINQNNFSNPIIIEHEMQINQSDPINNNTFGKENFNNDVNSTDSLNIVTPNTFNKTFEIPNNFVTKTEIEKFVYTKETIDTDENNEPSPERSVIQEVTTKKKFNIEPISSEKESTLENLDDYKIFDLSMEDRLSSILKSYMTFDGYDISSPYSDYYNSKILLDNTMHDRLSSDDNSKEKFTVEEFSPSRLTEYYKKFSLFKDW